MESEGRQIDRPRVTVPDSAPVIAVYLSEDSDDVTYFFSEEEADAAITPEMTRAALDLAGAWSDLDGDEVDAALYRIGHESTPTPPIEFDWGNDVRVSGAMKKLLDFLNRSGAANIPYRLEHVRDSVMVHTAIPGERWEIEFFDDGHVEVERFVSTGEIEGDASLAQLFDADEAMPQ